MKRHGQAIVVLLSMLMICAAACGGGASIAPTTTPTPSLTPHAPTVNYLPEGWNLSYQVAYGEITIPGEPKMGFLKYTGYTPSIYTPQDSEASVYIEYGDLPTWALDKTDDVGALLEEFLARSNTSCREGYTPDELGSMIFCDSPAAYARFSLPDVSMYGIAVLCVKGSVMIAVDASWWVSDKEADVMSIIGNISY